MDRVYLDYNATAPVRPALRSRLLDLVFGGPEAPGFGNASSVHWAGQQARQALEAARQELAAAFDRRPSEVIFTSGGTEADNLAIFGALRHPKAAARRLVVSSVEHPAVRAAANQLRGEGIEVEEIGVDADGRLDLDALSQALERPAGLVSVMAVNNETGIVHPIPEVRARCAEAGAPLHVDAVQAVGRLPLDPTPDLIAISGHKLGGPKGVGALLVRESVPLLATAVGGPQERGARAGTESIGLCAGLAAAVTLAAREREAEAPRLAALRDRIDRGLAALPGVRVLDGAPRVANTTCAVLADVEGEVVLQGLDLEGIAASSGSACSSGSLEPSHVLAAMGIPPALALSALRLSLGWASTDADVDRLLAVLPGVLARARG